jgi:hypothetical protein
MGSGRGTDGTCSPLIGCRGTGKAFHWRTTLDPYTLRGACALHYSSNERAYVPGAVGVHSVTSLVPGWEEGWELQL